MSGQTSSLQSRSGLDALLAPNSIAIVGASNDPTRIGGRPIQHLKNAGYGGAIYPVNPGREQVQGIKAYRRVADIDGEIDCAVIALSAQDVLPTVRECAEKGVKSLVIFSAGFAEMGEAGREAQQEIVAIARRTAMRVLGPNCLGAFNVQARACMTFSAAFDVDLPPAVRRFGLASQSGGYGSHILKLAQMRGLAVGHMVTTGNECDVDVGEAMAWLAGNPDVDAILGYIEGLRSAEHFLRALEIARQNKKPVILMKVGQTSEGAAAAQSHTAALAGADAVYDAVFREYGVYRAETTDDLLDVAYALSRGPLPADDGLCIVTPSGGMGVHMADMASKYGLRLPPLAPEAQQQLRAMLPNASTVNPIDTTAQVNNDISLFAKSLDLILAAGGYGSLMCWLGLMASSPVYGGPLLEACAEMRRKYPEVCLHVSPIAPPERVREYEEAGLLVFEDPARGIKAIGALRGFVRAFSAEFPARAQSEPLGVKLAAGVRYSEVDGKAILARCGVGVPAERVVADPADAAAAAEEVSFPVALKVVSADILHKTEAGGVALGLKSAAEVAEAAHRMAASVAEKMPHARIEGYLISKMVSGGVECIVGVHRDPVFGPVVMFGIGGILVELLADVVFRLAPVSADDAFAMVKQVRGYPLLAGHRGKPAADVPALVEAIVAVSRLAAENADMIRTIEVNPILVMPAGGGVVALDAVIETDVARQG